MKKLLTMLCVAAAALFATSCYDDSALRESIEKHEERISALEQLTKEMNTNISSLAQLVETLQKGGGVASVVEIREAGEVIGYAVTLTDGSTVTIYGNETSDLLDGTSAVIGVKTDADGTYYWTVNGEWMLDEDGNKVAAASTADSGASGITPQLKIEDDFWYVSYDNGKNWEKLGKAVAESSCIFKNVTKTEEAVIFELVDGTVLTLPLGNAFRIIFDNVPSAPIEAGQTVEISYSIEGLVGDADIFIIADDARFDTELVQETASTGKILVALCCDSDSEIKGKIALFALSESGLTVGKSLDLVSGVFRISEHGADLYTIGSKACQLELPIRTNVDFAVEVYADWLTYVETKAVEEKTLVFDVQENSGVARREAVVRVYTDQSSLYFTIVQESHAAYFNLSFTWDETASYGMAEIDFSVLTDAYGNTLASVLGYDSWDDVRMAIGDYDTYRAFAGEVVVTGYDPNTGDSFGYLDYTSNAIGYWLDTYGQPSMWGTDEARTYWEFYADAEEDVYSRCSIGVLPGNISVGDVYKQGYMFKSPYGVAKVEVTITIEAFVDPEIGLYPEDATPGIFDIEVSQNLDLSKQTYEFEGIRTSEAFDEVKTLLGMTSYELYTSINAGYIMSDDGSLYSGLKREVILPDGTTVDGSTVWVKSDNSYADWEDDMGMLMQWTYGYKSDDYSFFFCPYPMWSETGWFFSDEVKAMIGKTMTATFRITYIPSDENGVACGNPTIINVNVAISVTDATVDTKLERLELSEAPASIVYYVYDKPVKFNPVGMVVNAVYSDGTVEVVDNSELTFTDVDADTYAVTVSYKGHSIDVEVKAGMGLGAVGAVDFSNTWWTTFSEDVKVSSGDTHTWKMMCYSAAVNNWQSPCTILRKADMTENAVVRMDHYGWGAGYDSVAVLESNWNWDNYLTYLNMSTIVLSVTNNGDGTADIRYDVTYVNGEEHYQTYKGIAVDSADLQAAIVVEGAYLVFFE